jgi:hypothetical protein
MSNFNQRLNRLEPGPQHNEYLREVCLRLMRYGIETRNQVQAAKLPALAWGAEAETIYQQWKKNHSFDAIEREILANPTRDEPKIERPADV